MTQSRQTNSLILISDWSSKKYITLVMAIQIGMWGAIGLDTIGIHIPLVRQVISFIYLIFIPGILILQLIKLHKLSIIEKLLYTVGLSIATLMFIGAFINTTSSLFGISKPISLMPLMISISTVVLILCILCYARDKKFSNPSFINASDILSVPALFLSIIPFLAVFGTYLVNFHQNNVILMFLIVIIALIPILIGFNKLILPKFYPLAVFAIAISLLFHSSLISMYISGWDIQNEYYLSSLVINNGIWDSTIPYNTNGMLSLVMLAPIYSVISGLNLTWILKIIYPVLFSLVPIGLYHVFQRQTDDKIAFLSVFFFMSLFAFYTEMLQLARQQIAELFLVLIILLLIDKNMNRMKRSVLLIIFAFSLGVSHYGLSYIFMASLFVVWAITYFYIQYTNKKIAFDITTSFVLLFITFVISWYMYISSLSSLVSIIHIGEQISSSIFTDFLDLDSAQGAAIILNSAVSPLHTISKYLHLITQFFIGIGIFNLILNRSKLAFEIEYYLFSLVFFLILVSSIAVPYFASSLNTSRLYQISLIFLAPFCVIGAITFFGMVTTISMSAKMEQYRNQWMKILSIFLAIFLLFNSGWIYEVVKDAPSSVPLSAVDYPIFNEQEVIGAKWLIDVRTGVIYGDYFRFLLPNSYKWGAAISIPGDLNKMKTNSYIYFGTFNIINEKVLINHQKGVNKIREYIDLKNMVNYKKKIYDNGGSRVYRL